MDIPQVKELLGHDDISTTMPYVHYNQEQAFEAAKVAEQVELAQLVGGRKVDGVKVG